VRKVKHVIGIDSYLSASRFWQDNQPPAWRGDAGENLDSDQYMTKKHLISIV